MSRLLRLPGPSSPLLLLHPLICFSAFFAVPGRPERRGAGAGHAGPEGPAPGWDEEGALLKPCTVLLFLLCPQGAPLQEPASPLTAALAFTQIADDMTPICAALAAMTEKQLQRMADAINTTALHGLLKKLGLQGVSDRLELEVPVMLVGLWQLGVSGSLTTTRSPPWPHCRPPASMITTDTTHN